MPSADCLKIAGHVNELKGLLASPTVSDRAKARQALEETPGAVSTAEGTEGSGPETEFTASSAAQTHMSIKSVALSAFGLDASPELLTFLEGVQGRLGAQASNKVGKLLNDVKKAITTGTRLLSDLPDVDADEEAYRRCMGGKSQQYGEASRRQSRGVRHGQCF